MKPIHIFISLVVLAVLSAVVTSFLVIGSPSAERARKLDEQRVNALQQISGAVEQYYNTNQKYLLPEVLDEISRQSPNVYYLPSLVDPKTGQPYEYRRTENSTYELCAYFETDSSVTGQQLTPYKMMPQPATAQNQPNFWSHTTGRHCFLFTAVRWPRQ